jgi:N-acetylglucosaminyl-diphospho-decaprenol L-rhamnosyltransferase
VSAAARPARVGVAIVTRNRREQLLATLARLRALPERPPILVADNGSSDGTPEAVRERHPDVELLALGENRGAAARNAAVWALATPYVAFSDDDSWWEPGALERSVRLFGQRPTLGLVQARILVGPERRLDPTCAVMRRSPLAGAAGLPGPAILGFVACGAVVRRASYLAVGGFHPRFGFGGEEELMALDLAVSGWELAYVDSIVAHHHPDGGDARPNRSDTALRNALWVAWMRRSVPAALRRTVALAAHAVRGRRPAVLVEAARGLPWVLRERRALPRRVERAARATNRIAG